MPSILCRLLIGGAAASIIASSDLGAAVFTDPADPKLPPDFAIQGEYVGGSGEARIGCQVIALGDGAFQAVVFPGGLPGDGGDAKRKSLMAGTMKEPGKAEFAPATGTRKYLAKRPGEFSATSTFPPPGQLPYSAVISGAMTVTPKGGAPVVLERTVRQSPTLGAKPPAGAVVLFDGTSLDAWEGGRLDAQTSLLNTDGKNVTAKQSFSDFTLHLEFMLPFEPHGRGQGRGNSGLYLIGRYEMQVLDSFGLDGRNNECGGIYTKADPLVNMCLPPLTWQTYDVDFTNAVVDAAGVKTASARITARHNGVVIHDALEVNGPTAGARQGKEGTPGRIFVQGHGHPLQYRNVWVVAKPQ